MTSILVLETNTEVRRLFEAALQGAGYRVHLAASAAEGYDVLRQSSVAMVIADLNLPEGRGLEMVTVVRQQFPGTKVLGMSTEASEYDVVEAGAVAEYSRDLA
jgi:CheY-like chemotaxis protein